MLTLHVIFVIITLATVLFSDEQGLMWFLGKKQALSQKLVHTLHIVVSVGLGGILLTGGLMLLDRSLTLLSDPVFITKMIFVLALTINAFFVESLSRLATSKPFSALSRAERTSVLISGGVSALSWAGAALFGLILSHFRLPF